MLVRKVLEQNKDNVSKTTRILDISHHTVRRARDGTVNIDYKIAKTSIKNEQKQKNW